MTRRLSCLDRAGDGRRGGGGGGDGAGMAWGLSVVGAALTRSLQETVDQ